MGVRSDFEDNKSKVKRSEYVDVLNVNRRRVLSELLKGK